MIKLKRVYHNESETFKETDIEFTYKDKYGTHSIVEYLKTGETLHIITYTSNIHTNSRFNPKNEIIDTDFIQAFNQYFEYKLPN